MTDGSNSQSGSGFFVTANTIATNFHVIEDMTSGTVRVVGSSRVHNIIGVVAYDEEKDLAILQIATSIGKPLVLGGSQKPAVGEDIWAVGNPSGLEGTFSPGIVSALREFVDGSLIQITAPISPGSSGGPVVNNRAEVVGIAVGSRESGQALNFAIPVSALKTLQSNSHSPVTVRHAGLNLAKPSPRVAEVKPIPPPRSIPTPVPTPRPIVVPTPTPRPVTVIPESPRKAEASEPDQILWNEVSKQNTRESYAFYLREQPQGAYSAEARRRITAFDEAAERARWDVAVAGNSKSSFETYLSEYPNGRFVSQANDRIKQFDRAEEDAVWKSAEEEKTEYGYTGYLRKYPAGVYASVARLRLKDMGASLIPDGSVGTFITNSIGMQLAWIPSGSFMMGSPASEANRSNDEGPQRLVTIARGFWMGRYEVTQGQYEAVMGTNPSNFKNCGKDCPVEQVSWNDAKEFISRLNARNDGFVYSLPSEAEWEYAARAGTTTAFAFGNSLSSTQANFDGNYPYGNAPKGPYLERTTKVGSYRPNAWGLYDMHGNVWEWAEDIYQDSYTGLPTDGSANTTRGDSSFRLLRGGSWYIVGLNARSADRYRIILTYRSFSLGFRVVARAR